ncbi:MAG: dipeptidase [Synergistales bacterium]
MNQSKDIRERKNKPVVVEGHSDIPTDVFLRRANGEHQVLDNRHYERLSQGGLSLQVMAIYVESRYTPWRSLDMSLRQQEALLQDLSESQHFFLVGSAKDLARVPEEGKIGVLIDLEGAEPLEAGTEMLHLFFRLGTRMLGVTWNQRNALASGSDDEISCSGLTSFGREIVTEAAKLGMVIDVSHMSSNGVRDTLSLLKSPVIASHSGAKAVYDHPRNLSDEHIRSIAKSGGLVGVPAFPKLIAKTNASIQSVAEHVVHMLKIAGEEHVGIGADFVDFFDDLIKTGKMGEEWTVPEVARTQGFWSASEIPNLGKELAIRGVSPSTVEGVLGENFIRVFERCLPKD